MTTFTVQKFYLEQCESNALWEVPDIFSSIKVVLRSYSNLDLDDKKCNFVPDSADPGEIIIRYILEYCVVFTWGEVSTPGTLYSLEVTFQDTIIFSSVTPNVEVFDICDSITLIPGELYTIDLQAFPSQLSRSKSFIASKLMLNLYFKCQTSSLLS